MTAPPTSEARRSPRVAYHAAVELTAQTEDDESPRALPAEALDLGVGGMRVAVAERLPVGAPLTCHLTLDGHSTALGGHVVWLRSHTSPRPHGMGIRFDALPDQDQRLLSNVVERSAAGYRPVQLQFDGAGVPIVARALPHDSGITLSAPLPILDRGAGVEVKLDGETPSLRGRVDQVQVVESGRRRRLEVEIAFGETEGARYRRDARFASGELSAIPQLHDADRAEGAAGASARRAGRGRVALSVIAALSIGVGAGFALATRMLSGGSGRVSEAGRETIAARGASTPPVTSASTSTPPPPPTKSSPTPTKSSSTPTPAAPVDVNPSLVATALVPSVSVEEHATVLRLPFSGSLEGMVARTWAAPAALALDLPSGSVGLRPGSHALRGGSVAGLRVNDREGASLLRVHLAAPIGRYAVSAHDGVLELRLFAAQ